MYSWVWDTQHTHTHLKSAHAHIHIQIYILYYTHTQFLHRRAQTHTHVLIYGQTFPDMKPALRPNLLSMPCSTRFVNLQQKSCMPHEKSSPAQRSFGLTLPPRTECIHIKKIRPKTVNNAQVSTRSTFPTTLSLQDWPFRVFFSRNGDLSASFVLPHWALPGWSLLFPTWTLRAHQSPWKHRYFATLALQLIQLTIPSGW